MGKGFFVTVQNLWGEFEFTRRYRNRKIYTAKAKRSLDLRDELLQEGLVTRGNGKSDRYTFRDLEAYRQCLPRIIARKPE